MTFVIAAVVIMALMGDFYLVYWLLRRHGFFVAMKPHEEAIEPICFAYEIHRGPYSDMAPVIDTVYCALKVTYAIPVHQGIGIYYDNPKKVVSKKLRSIGGGLLTRQDYDYLREAGAPFRLGALRACRAVSITFPYNGKLSLVIGSFRVYRQLKEYLAAHSLPMGPVVEIYDFEQRQTRYIRPLDISNEDLERLLGDSSCLY